MLRTQRESFLFYDRKYDQGPEKLHSYKIKLFEFLPQRGSKILDVGCGSGIMAEKMQSLGHNVIGIDVSISAIKSLTEKRIHGIITDINQGLPFEDESFDVVWCSDLIEHIDSPRFLLQEFHRVLKEFGLLLLSTPNSAYFGFRILHLFGKTCSEVQHPHHIHFFSLKTLMMLLKSTHFDIRKVIGRNMPIAIPLRILPFLTIETGRPEKRIMRCMKILGFRVEDTLTQGLIMYMSFYSKRAISFFADEFLIKAKKTEILSCGS